MLRKLSVKLTMVNALISGVILLALAFAVLRVAENAMTAQYENDLNAFSTQMVTLAMRTISSGDEAQLHLETPSKYAIYVTDESIPLTVEEKLTDDDLKDILPELRASLSDESVMGPQLEHGMVGVWNATAPTASDTVKVPGAIMVKTVTAKDNYFYTIAGTPYRVRASIINAPEEENMMLVMEDRTDELQSRYRLRWTFGFCIGGGLLLIVLASLYLSSRAIKPVDASIRQQRAFVAAASHELRTPVAAISANAEVLRDAELQDFEPFLDSIQAESLRMTRLISDLLTLARADAGELPMEKALLDAGEVAEDAVRLMRPLAEKNGLTLRGNTHEALMVGDGDRLRQVLVALLDNALRYTPEGGTVTVTANKVGRQVILSVTDTGPGIPEEHKGRIFDRFYRVDTARGRNQGGAGLGLSVAKQYVEQMGGFIQYLDLKGGGATFEIKFEQKG